MVVGFPAANSELASAHEQMKTVWERNQSPPINGGFEIRSFLARLRLHKHKVFCFCVGKLLAVLKALVQRHAAKTSLLFCAREISLTVGGPIRSSLAQTASWPIGAGLSQTQPQTRTPPLPAPFSWSILHLLNSIDLQHWQVWPGATTDH